MKIPRRNRYARYAGHGNMGYGSRLGGKSTLARSLARRCDGECFDADQERHWRHHVGFSAFERRRSMRRLAARATAFCLCRLIIVAAISPTRSDRLHAVRRLRQPNLLVHIGTAQSVCEQRDRKDLYKRARQGVEAHVCGVNIAYEEPRRPALRLAWER